MKELVLLLVICVDQSSSSLSILVVVGRLELELVHMLNEEEEKIPNLLEKQEKFDCREELRDCRADETYRPLVEHKLELERRLVLGRMLKEKSIELD